MKKNQSNLSLLLSYAGRRKFLTYAALGFSALSSLLALVPFIYIWAIIRDILEVAPNYSLATNLTHYGWMAVATAVGSIMLYVVALACSHVAAFRIAANMRKTLMEHVMSLPIGFLDRLGSGKVRKWVDESTASTETYLAHQLPDKAGMFATVVGLGFLMFIFDWKMGLLCISTALFALVVMMAFMVGPNLKKGMAEYGKALDSMSNEAVEYVRGIPVVKTFGQSVFSFKRFKSAIDVYQRWVIQYTMGLRFPMVFYTAFVNATFAVLIGATLFIVTESPSNTFMLNLLYYIIITPALSITLTRIMFASENKMIVEEALKRANALLDIAPLSPGNVSVPTSKDLVLDHVTFRYPEAERDAVHDVSLTIQSGKKIAFVGPSGGGKTTLASLIARFFDTTSGEIRLGGVDVKCLNKRELMNTISFVFQDSKLLQTSIFENVRLGKPNASREEVLAALHKAQCDDILEKLPDGIDTIIGSQGIYLSGGEQQRVAIARVILKNTPIIILDEATAFADPDNEARVQAAFSSLSEGKTIIMIAHRLSSIINADMIYVLEDGGVVESGSHRDLLGKQGKYASMWNQYVESIKWNLQ